MNIRERRVGNAAIIEIDGRLTVNDHPGRLRAVVWTALQDGAEHVVLNLAGVDYLDSTRLGELIASHVTVTRQNGRLSLVGVPARVNELLTLAGLGQVFERFDTVDEAIGGDSSSRSD